MWSLCHSQLGRRVVPMWSARVLQQLYRKPTGVLVVVFCAAQFSYCCVVSTTGTQTDSGTGTVEFQGKCYMSLENLLSQVKVRSVVNHSYLPTTKGRLCFHRCLSAYFSPLVGFLSGGALLYSGDRGLYRGCLCPSWGSLFRKALCQEGVFHTVVLILLECFLFFTISLYCREINSMRIQDLPDVGRQLQSERQLIILTIFTRELHEIDKTNGGRGAAHP